MTGSPFDSIATDYDRREVENPVMQLMRSRSIAALAASFPTGARLLDVGCGTGTEAIWLTARGRKVMAVDPSAEMLGVLARHAAASGFEVPSRRLHAGDLSTLVDELGEASFDGAYSSFGALNSEPALEPVVRALATLVKPRGRIVLSVMNRWSIAEMAALMAARRPRQALRRLQPSLSVPVGSNFTEVRYPSWRELRRALSSEFEVVSVHALPLVLMPYAWPALSRHPRLYKAAWTLDSMLSRRRPFAWLGDHLHVVAERRAQARLR